MGILSERQIDLREEKISRVEAGDPSIKAERKLFESINFASTLQMIGLLFESEEGFEFPILSRSDTGNPSTAEDVLLKLQARDESGFIEKLLEYRGLQKLYSTYIKGIYEQHLTPRIMYTQATCSTAQSLAVFHHGDLTSRIYLEVRPLHLLSKCLLLLRTTTLLEVDLCLIAGSMVKTTLWVDPH